MQPRDRQRLTKIAEYCEDIQGAVARYGPSFEAFKADIDYQYSVSFCILQIGELVSNLSEEYRNATMDQIQWQKIRGMRNIVVHDYGNVDLNTVWEVTTASIPQLYNFCQEQLNSIQ